MNTNEQIKGLKRAVIALTVAVTLLFGTHCFMLYKMWTVKNQVTETIEAVKTHVKSTSDTINNTVNQVKTSAGVKFFKDLIVPEKDDEQKR